jgi:phosphatidylglycerophosphate synthase
VASLLVVVPPEPAARVSAAALVAGLPLLRRIVLAGARAGFDRILVHGAAGPADLLAGTSAEPLAADAALPRARRRIVVVPANVVPQPRWLRALRETDLAAEAAYVDASLAAVIDTEEPGRVLGAAAASRSADELAATLRAGFADPPEIFDAAGRFAITAPADVGPAERWLLRSLIKQSEGFMSRHLERRISLAITRRLVGTRITPDAMTLVSVAIGLAGAPFFLSAEPVWQLTGALLFLAHSILDGCDGELARLKFMESRRGAVLDFWGDNLVHVAVFGCIALGWSLAIGAAWPLVLGAVAIASTLGSAACVFRRTTLDVVPGAGASATDRVAEAMAHRDFIYLVVLLAALGRVDWFLALAAAGTPIFLLLLLWVGASRRPA